MAQSVRGKFYYEYGWASGEEWNIDEDDNKPWNLHLRPSVLLKTPAIKYLACLWSLISQSSRHVAASNIQQSVPCQLYAMISRRYSEASGHNENPLFTLFILLRLGYFCLSLSHHLYWPDILSLLFLISVSIKLMINPVKCSNG